jgi:hypothetical protein
MRPQMPLPLTLEEHAELGEELRQTRMRMHELCALVVGVYGPQNRAAFSFHKVTEALDRLCGDLQTQALEDLPGYKLEGLYL